MAITNGYSTLAEVKARLSISDTTDDTVLEAVITAVSRFIDDYCNRRFYAVTETRYYTAVNGDELWLDDLLSVTTLKTDEDGDRTYEITWTTADFDLMPFNAALESQAQPYSHIRVTPDGDYSFPTTQKGVQIAGSFGFASTTPVVIKEACLIQTQRIFKRKEAVFGVAGSPEFGQMMLITRLDPDVRLLLAPFRRIVIG